MSEQKIITLTYDEPEGSTRLDKYLVDQFPDYSRSYFQELISQGIVTVNGKAVNKPSFPLKNNFIVSFYFPPAKEYKATPQKVDFEIIFEHEDFLIINKPAGLIVHAAYTDPEQPTLVDGLLYHFKEFEQFDDMQRPGIVHRLDKDTSGLMVVARNRPSQIKLAAMFKERTINKTYLTVVEGFTVKKGVIDYPIGRHPTLRHKMSHQGIAARAAKSCYTALKYYENETLLAVKIETGRTHQIRVHCAAAGHKMLGDQTYGVKSKLIKRQALHAWKLEFEYKNKQYAFSCPVPADFAKLLKNLQKETSF